MRDGLRDAEHRFVCSVIARPNSAPDSAALTIPPIAVALDEAISLSMGGENGKDCILYGLLSVVGNECHGGLSFFAIPSGACRRRCRRGRQRSDRCCPAGATRPSRSQGTGGRIRSEGTWPESTVMRPGWLASPACVGDGGSCSQRPFQLSQSFGLSVCRATIFGVSPP